MPSLLNPADPEKRYRGKIMQQRFKSPPGFKSGALGSFVGALLEYKDIVEKNKAEPKGGFDVWLSSEVDKAINPTPSAAPIPAKIDLIDAERRTFSRKRAKKKGRTILAGQLMTGLGSGLKSRIGE